MHERVMSEEVHVLRRLLAQLLAISMLCGSATASAQSAAVVQPRTLVFEAHVGEPSLAETMLMTRLRDELESLGLVAQPASLLKTVGGRVPRPGIADPSVTLAELAKLVDTGHNAFTDGDFETAVVLLTKAVRLIKRNPALLVLDTGNAAMVFRAYASLGFSLNKRTRSAENRDTDKRKVSSDPQDQLKLTPEAEAVLSKLIRMYPAMRVQKNDYGPIAEQAYLALHRRVLARGSGRLVLRANDGHAMIFVDGQMRGLGTVKVAELLVGDHDVFVQTGTGRRYELSVNPNEETVFEIDPKIDTCLSVNDERAWFQFSTETERAREAVCGGELSRRWATSNTVAVVGPMAVNGKPAIIATLYRLNGEAVRPTGFVPLEQAGVASIHALARYIADGTPGEGVRLIMHGGPSDKRSWTSQKSEERHPSLLSALVIGTGSIVVVGGAVVYVASKADDFTKPTYNDRREPAVWAMTGGSAVLGVGIYSWVRETRPAGVVTSAALGTGIAAIVAGTELYLTDQDQQPSGPGIYQRPYHRESATIGAILGVSGVALTAFGFWRLRQETSASSARRSAAADQEFLKSAVPVLSVTPGHAVIGWAGTF